MQLTNSRNSTVLGDAHPPSLSSEFHFKVKTTRNSDGKLQAQEASVLATGTNR
jgi:hypothetical protein